MPDYTPYQRKLIERYYDQRDVIMLTKLEEIVSELFLAEDDKKTKRLWDRARKAMKGLQVPDPLAEHIIEQGDITILAGHIRDWQSAAKKNG